MLYLLITSMKPEGREGCMTLVYLCVVLLSLVSDINFCFYFFTSNGSFCFPFSYSPIPPLNPFLWLVHGWIILMFFRYKMKWIIESITISAPILSYSCSLMQEQEISANKKKCTLFHNHRFSPSYVVR